jgi:hypothetical protein
MVIDLHILSGSLALMSGTISENKSAPDRFVGLHYFSPGLLTAPFG